MIESLHSFESPASSGLSEADLGELRPASATTRRRVWRVTGNQAVATWTLQRHRQTGELSHRERAQLTTIIRGLQVDGSLLRRGDQVFAMRPTAAKLLELLLAKPAADLTVEALCEAAYEQPVSMRAIRQSVFRINRAFENVDCPLTVLCHASRLLLRTRFRTF